MATERFEAEKFSGKNDFGLWRMKMRAMLIQQGLETAIKDEGEKGKPSEEGDEKSPIIMQEIMDKVHSVIILYLVDNVLHEMSRETATDGIQMKLESLFMTKSLENRLFMKHKLYLYKFLEELSINKQLDEFNKLVDDLENIDVKLEDEDKAIIFLHNTITV